MKQARRPAAGLAYRSWATCAAVAGFLGALLASSTIAAAELPALPIIVYHQLREGADGPPEGIEAISLERFTAQMRHLSEAGFVTLSVGEVVAFARGNPPPAYKIVAIHFDDASKSQQLAVPVLDRYGFKATFWIIAGTGIGGFHMDWEEIEAIDRNPRYDIYSHSMTHAYKPGDTMTDWQEGRTPGKGVDQIRWELAESRRVLAERLGHPIPYLSWPGGHYNDAMIQLAAELGYEALFTVNPGLNHPGDNVLKLRRTMIDGGCDEQVFAAILRDGMAPDCTR